MAQAVEVSIRSKLTVLIVSIATGSTAVYLALAASVFHSDKKELIYELNASAVQSLAAEVDAFVALSREKARLIAQLGISGGASVSALIENDPDLLSFSLLNASSLNAPLYEFKTKGVTVASRERKEPPVAEIMGQGSALWSSSHESLAGPAVSLGFLVERSGSVSASTSVIAVLEMRADRLLKIISDRALAEVFVTDLAGRPVLSVKEVVPDDWIAASLLGPARLETKEYDSGGKHYIGATAGAGSGIARVFSRVDADVAFNSARGLFVRSAFFFVWVLTACIFIAAWFSRGLTQPIRDLVAATQRLAKGDFQVTLHVKGRDEVARLASSFNAMAIDLARQRAELDRSHSELELKIQERTHALETEKKSSAETQQVLLKTTRLATLGEMAGITAHEVLNPLNNIGVRVETFRSKVLELRKADLGLLRQIIDGWTEAYSSGGTAKLVEELSKPAQGGKALIEEDMANIDGITRDLSASFQQISDDLDFYSGQILRVTRIVNNMRSLSRVGGERRAFDIHRPIEDTLLTLKDSAEKRRIQLIREFSQEAREQFVVQADPDELVQVFSNLIKNAMDALYSVKDLRAGEVRVRTSIEGDRIVVRIIDNGPGVASEVKDRLFEPSVTTKGPEDGTGLGLSICRRIARAFGGDVEWMPRVDGQPGALFQLWLPRSLS